MHELRLLSVGLWTTGGAVHTYWLLGAAIRTMVPYLLRAIGASAFADGAKGGFYFFGLMSS
ncbi:MAG TPA: hypothetical protein DCF77_18060 [Pseudomonas sp.]|nr:hypothetical protein [Pseudomonas sp.]